MKKYQRKGYNPKSLENLKPMSDRSPSERKRLGSKGGNKSARLNQERNPKVVIIEKSCPLCKGSIKIKAETLEDLRYALLAIEEKIKNEMQDTSL